MELTTVAHPNGISEIRLTGRLNMATATRVRDAVASEVGENRARIAVDLAEVVFLDSSGLGALIAGLKMTREAGGDLVLLHPTEQVQLVLELTNMDSVLKTAESVAEAYPNA